MSFQNKETNVEKQIPKHHTPAYLYLKKVATELSDAHTKALKHSPETAADVHASCVRAWQDAVRHVVSPHGLNAPVGHVNAARRRLRDAKNLLTFLAPPKQIAA